jgi:hypothetical protein
MLRSLKDFEGYAISATDGDIGGAVNFLIDDERWTVRYLVAKTGTFFDERQVLISPISFRETNAITRKFHVALTRDKVKHSPGIDADKPVSRQHEQEYSRYYGYSHYWGYAGSWGMGSFPGLLAVGEQADERPYDRKEPAGDQHLRSAAELRRYHVQGTDGAIGHVDDFIVDDESWEVRYLVIDTSNWWFGKKVLVPPQWATGVSWEDGQVDVGLSRETIKSCPEWNPAAMVNREYEVRLYDYYRRSSYWDKAAGAETTRPPASTRAR